MEVLLMLLVMVLVGWSQIKVQGAYSKYAKIANKRGLSGKEIAEQILAKNFAENVEVKMSNAGTLSDHYDPRTKSISLSPDVYQGKSIAAAAVAAHECGHAIQYQSKYAGIGVRNAILPMAIISGYVGWTVVSIGLFMYFSGGGSFILFIGLALIAVIAVFQLITLPIELNASSRALTILQEENFILNDEVADAKKMLDAAAFTYLAALLATVLQILRVLTMIRRRD